MSGKAPNPNDIQGLFQSDEAGQLGLSKQGSDILIANLNGTTLPMCVGNFTVDSITSDDVTAVFLAVDASPSMEPVRDLLIETVNEVMIAGLKGASKKSASAVVVGGLAFSTDIWPLWKGGFHHLDQMPDLTQNEYDPSQGHLTNLYQAMMDGITGLTAHTIDIFQQTGTPPKGIVVVLTDGANNTGRCSSDQVRALTNGLSRELYTFAAAVFETNEPVDGNKIARDSGFQVFDFKKGVNETVDDVKKRFRHMIGVLSSSIVRASQAQVGSASQSFWTGADQQ